MSKIGGSMGRTSPTFPSQLQQQQQQRQPQKSSQKKKKPQSDSALSVGFYRKDKLTAMDFLKGVRFDKGYIEPLIDDVYGVGNTYSGLYYVDKVTHSFTAGVYRQSFKLERNPTE